MGAGASVPKTEAEALSAGYTQAQIDEYKQGVAAAAEAKSTGDSDGASRSRPTLTTEQRLPDVRVACVGVVVRTAAARMPSHHGTYSMPPLLLLLPLWLALLLCQPHLVRRRHRPPPPPIDTRAHEPCTTPWPAPTSCW